MKLPVDFYNNRSTKPSEKVFALINEVFENNSYVIICV